MANYSNHTSSTVGRNRAIARDLENLPLELIEQVIEELTFECVIRLSIQAGLQLTQAFTISPSWRHLMGKEEDRKTWQTYLGLTEDLNVLCFDTRRHVRPFFEEPYRTTSHCSCTSHPYLKCSVDVAFLQKSLSQFNYTADTIRRQWLDALSALFLCTRSRRGLSLSGVLDDFSEAEQALFIQILNTERISLSVEELESSIQLYQRALTKQRTGFVKELRRLAILYETHPSLLKVPFAPQNWRPRAAHVPQQFRSRARRFEKAPLTLESRASCRTYFQDEHPALVPYDWTLRFLVNVLSKEQVVDAKCQFVTDGLARYFHRKCDRSPDWDHVRTRGTPWSLPCGDKEQPEFLAGKNGPTRGRSHPYAAHTDIELTWLEAFVEVVSHLIGRFPQAAEAAQAKAGLKETDPGMIFDLLTVKMEEL